MQYVVADEPEIHQSWYFNQIFNRKGKVVEAKQPQIETESSKSEITHWNDFNKVNYRPKSYCGLEIDEPENLSYLTMKEAVVRTMMKIEYINERENI